MSESVSEHIDQSIPYEWHAVDLGDRTAIVRSVPEGTAEMYLVSARSRNVRMLAQADAVLYEGNVTEPVYDADAKSVEFIHDYAGRVGFHLTDEWLDDPAVRLKRLPTAPPAILEETA